MSDPSDPWRLLPDLWVSFDAELVHRACNEAYARACGSSPEELLGQPAQAALGKACEALVQPVAERTLAGEQAVWRGWVEFPAQGRTLVHAVAAPWGGEVGQGFVLSLRDFTSEAPPDEDTAERLRLLLETTRLTHIGGWELETETQHLRWTRETHRILGVPPDQPPRLEDGLSFFLPEDRPVLEEALRRASEEQVGYDLQQQIVQPDGTLRWTRSICEPVVSEGRVVRLLGSFQDITDLKEAEARAQGLEEQVREAQRFEAFGQVAAGVAHDFNNLLTVILGNLALTEGNEEAVARISAAGQRGAVLTRQLLALGRQSILRPRSLDLNEVLARALDLLSSGVPESVELIAEPDPGAHWVSADPDHLLQVILNLVLNARDAVSPAGGGRIVVRVGRANLDELPGACRAGDYVVLSVEDNGAGVPPELQDKVFEPFFSTKGVGRGSGLGLSTVRGFVEQSQGCISLDSEPGRTCFEVFLPAAPPPELAAVTEKAPAPLEEAPAAPANSVLLIVEDEELLREMLASALAQEGYEVISAASPSEALELWEANEERIQFLLTDLVMPGMSGSALADRLHADRPELPVLYMSGYVGDPDFSARLEAEQLEVLEKPFRIRELLEKLAAALRERAP